MKINLVLLLSTFTILFSSSIEILEVLKTEADWKLYRTLDEGETIYRKSLNDRSLQAFKISKTIDFSPKLIFNTVLDIDNYGTILKSSNLDSRVLLSTSDYIDGYNYIYVDNYFVSDREYVFRMYSYEKSVEWHLIESSLEATDALYINAGAGYWDYEIIGDRYKISYSLYMDVGGSIPKFLDNKLNYSGILNVFRDVLNHSFNVKMGDSISNGS